MFIICALIPILALAGISYHRVIRQLQDQAFERLHQSAKSHALSIYERLLLADQQLQVVQVFQPLSKGIDFSDLPRTVMDRNSEFFIGLARVRDGEISSSWGSAAPPACLETIRKMVSAEERVRLATWTDSRDNHQWPLSAGQTILGPMESSWSVWLIPIIYGG